MVQYDLAFDNILDSMGMGEIITGLEDGFDYDDEDEEETKSETTASTQQKQRRWEYNLLM